MICLGPVSDINVAAVSAEKVRRGGLLDVHQEVPFEDKFALLVLLAFLVGLVVFPSQSSAAFAAVDVSHGMIPCGHLSIAWFSMDHVHDFFEEICTAVLPVEGPGCEGVNGGKMGTTFGTAKDASASEVTAIAHSHGGLLVLVRDERTG